MRKQMILVMLLLIAFSFAVSASCNNMIKDTGEGEEGIDCGGDCTPCLELICDNNKMCNINKGEDCDNCPGDCETCGVLCSDGKTNLASAEEGVDCGGYCAACLGICSVNGKCETDLINMGYSDNEDSQNCPEDCYCGDQMCDDYEMEFGTCTEDCPTALPTECGDGICDAGEDVDCPQDCQWEIVCGNSLCDSGEDVDCPQDCGAESETTGCGWNSILLVLIGVILGMIILSGVCLIVRKVKCATLPKMEIIKEKNKSLPKRRAKRS